MDPSQRSLSQKRLHRVRLPASLANLCISDGQGNTTTSGNFKQVCTQIVSTSPVLSKHSYKNSFSSSSPRWDFALSFLAQLEVPPESWEARPFVGRNKVLN